MDITNDIISFIFTEKQLSLPGLGLLSLSESSAYRSPNKTKIYSPKFNINLKDDQDYNRAINEKFYQFVANKHNTSAKQVEDAIHKYSIDILNNLANFNSARIENLGDFKRENDKIHFEFSPVFKDLLKEAYPDFPLLMIDRESETDSDKSNKSAKQVTPLTYKSKKTKKTGWIFPLFILTLLSLGFVCLMYCLSGILPENNSIDKTKSNKESVVQNKDLGHKSGVVPNDLSLLKKSGTKDKITDSKITPINIKGREEQLEDLDKIPIEELIELGSELKSKFNKSCIIIVGSFKRKSNSTRMKKRLVKDNFSPYVEKYGAFYRTGVIFDCNKKPLYDFLNELRVSIDKGSWVLKYK